MGGRAAPGRRRRLKSYRPRSPRCRPKCSARPRRRPSPTPSCRAGPRSRRRSPQTSPAAGSSSTRASAPCGRCTAARALFGPAVTAWCEPGDIGAALHAVALAGAGDVIVIDAGGCLQSAVVGEHLCGAARRNGAAGMIVNGAVRDIGPIAAWPDFPVFTLGNTARGPVSIERGTVGAAIVCGGIRVEPHDLILADDDGVVAIARAEADVEVEEDLRAELLHHLDEGVESEIGGVGGGGDAQVLGADAEGDFAAE